MTRLVITWMVQPISVRKYGTTSVQSYPTQMQPYRTATLPELQAFSIHHFFSHTILQDPTILQIASRTSIDFSLVIHIIVWETDEVWYVPHSFCADSRFGDKTTLYYFKQTFFFIFIFSLYPLFNSKSQKWTIEWALAAPLPSILCANFSVFPSMPQSVLVLILSTNNPLHLPKMLWPDVRFPFWVKGFFFVIWTIQLDNIQMSWLVIPHTYTTQPPSCKYPHTARTSCPPRPCIWVGYDCMCVSVRSVYVVLFMKLVAAKIHLIENTFRYYFRNFISPIIID